MKNTIQIIALIATIIFFTGCEDVVDIPLDTSEPKLVIDASIKWQKETTGEQQLIKLSKTTDFYNTTIPPANGATVTIKNLNTNDVALFEEFDSSGNYICNNFIPIVNNQYELTVIYEGQTYSSTANFIATPEIINIEQTLIDGFGSDKLLQVKFFFQDNPNEDNYYLDAFKNNASSNPKFEFGISEDRFTQGNLMFGLYIDDQFNSGDVLDVTLQGISKQHANYLQKLLSISGSSGGGPFATPPATLRGNIINQTNSNNFPFGYFNLSEVATDTYIIQ